jgi:hypothetical protein
MPRMGGPSDLTGVGGGEGLGGAGGGEGRGAGAVQRAGLAAQSGPDRRPVAASGRNHTMGALARVLIPIWTA